MKGVIKVTASKGGKTITSEVYGSMAEKETLFNRLMSAHKIEHNKRHLWKLNDIKLIKEIN